MKNRRLLVALLLLLVMHEAQAQTRGFVERFQTQTTADTWYQWANGTNRAPAWVNDADPYVWGSFINTPGYVYANSTSSGGKLTGNYRAARITAIEAEVYADYPSEVDGVDIYIFSAYNNTTYSYGYWKLVDSAWYRLHAPLDTNNWWVDGIGYTSLPSQALTQVVEVGIIAYPVGGLAQPTYINVDNVTLVPELIRPTLTIAMPPGQTQVGFFGEQGQSYTLNWCTSITQGWLTATGGVNVAGLGSGITFYDYALRTTAFYRVTSSILYSN